MKKVARSKHTKIFNHAHYYKSACTVFMPGRPQAMLKPKLIDEREQDRRSERLCYHPLYAGFFPSVSTTKSTICGKKSFSVGYITRWRSML